jgi:hypothetical protein
LFFLSNFSLPSDLFLFWNLWDWEFFLCTTFSLESPSRPWVCVSFNHVKRSTQWDRECKTLVCYVSKK